MKVHCFLFCLIMFAASCGNQDIQNPVDKNIMGTWTIYQVYANDHWGGALAWKDADFNKQLKFSADLKYYSKTDKDFELIGTYKKISEFQIEITLDKPLFPEYPTYLMEIQFDEAGRLTIPTGTFEGIVLEKYKLIAR
jgi:hypothetical protein